MRKRASTLTVTLLGLALLTLALGASQALGFGLKELDDTFNAKDGSPATQAGSHPFSQTTTLAFDTVFDPSLDQEVPDGDVKDLTVSLPPGLVGGPGTVPTCSNADFFTKSGAEGNCPPASQLGVNDVTVEELGAVQHVRVFNLIPPPGVAMRIGFVVIAVPVVIDLNVSEEPPYNVIATLHNIPNPVTFFRSVLTVWGVPAAAGHNVERHQPGCTEAECNLGLSEKPFLTLPRACEGPLPTTFSGDSWQEPGVFDEHTVFTHDSFTPPNPQGITGCSHLGFNPSISAQPTTKAASSPTGLDFSLNVNDEGLTNPSEEAVADSDIRKTEVTLPEGFSVNPSIAEGLAVCAEADLARETAFSEAGAGCPNASKIGTVEVETPLLDENVNGALYQAAPYENPFHNLITLYLVIKNPKLGIKVVQPLKVEADPVTGRLTTVAEEMPQLPFSHFRLHFREGARSPLASPPGCGAFSASATLYPWSDEAPVTTTSAFQIISGPESKPCPSGGLPPFKPGLIAGTLNNAAGRFSPFNVRLFRNDSEQEITHFSIKLPPGVLGKLAGIPFCPDAAIAVAKARTGPHGGQEEIERPSCSQASEIGHTLVGSGVGSVLAYAPGKLYLAGPYHGSALSFVAITAGKVGPFDLGTVVVRDALRIDPETAEVFVDATGSDPIPHIIQGVPVHLRDIRVYTDRPEFVLNPTSCRRTSTASTLLGSGLDFGSEADDRPVTVSTPFQAADCAALPFKPRLSLKLKGGTKRGSYPALRATLTMNGIGEAGVHRAEVILPKSEFIANAHFNTICTRVVFKQGTHPGEMCPPGSVYGQAVARTPILSEPLEGPVFLRSSEHQLPDVVASLHNGQIDVVLDGHVDSVKGRLRNTFESTPDAPVSSVTLSLLGGKKGLFENSTNLCKTTHKAEANFTGQNGKEWDFKPVVKPTSCGGRAKKQKRARHRAR
jgi:hypothetical protein